MQLLGFGLNDQRFAVPLAAVERVICAVEVTPLPGAPDLIHGVIDMHGIVLPVFNMRLRFQLPPKALGTADCFLIAHSASRLVALVIDEVTGVIDDACQAPTGWDPIASGLDQFTGLITLDDGLVLIHDLDKFLSLDDVRSLNQALELAQ